jgi:hypothetical protein
MRNFEEYSAKITRTNISKEYSEKFQRERTKKFETEKSTINKIIQDREIKINHNEKSTLSFK